MTRWSVLAMAIISSLISSSLNAREVELLAFTAPPKEVLDASNPGASSDVPAPEELGLEGALADGFAAFPSDNAAEYLDFSMPDQIGRSTDVPEAASLVPVPDWMRTGVLSGRGGGSPTLAALRLPVGICADAPYRRRMDLPASTEARRARLFPLIARVACEAGVPVGLFDALVGQESRYNPAALSPKGAVGLTQLMPATARYLNVVNPWNPIENLRGGARYLREQMAEFGRVDLALAAYNAGPGRVRAGRRVPPYRETVNYISRITQAWNETVARRAALLSFRPVRRVPKARSQYG